MCFFGYVITLRYNKRIKTPINITTDYKISDFSYFSEKALNN